MNPLLRLTLVALCIALCMNAAQAQTRYTLFSTAPKPSAVVVSHPASFVGVNGAAWRDAEMWLADRERAEITLAMPEGDVVTLDVERFHVVDENTPLYELSVGGMTQVPMPAAVLLRGSVRNSPTSHVMLAVFSTWATGYITLERAGTMKRYLLSPVSKTPNSVHIVNEDIYAQHPTPWNCGTEDTEFPKRDKGDGQEQTQAVTKIIRLALEGDEEYYIDHGRDVYKCAEYAQAVIGAMSDIYQRDVSAAVNTPWMGFWTSTDPYPGVTSGDILTQLRTQWNTNGGTVARSAVMLLSGQNGIGGVAYLDVLCTSNGYSVSGTNNTYTYPVAGYVWDTDVCSHELGHNVGARHTHSCTWAPPIDSCYAAEGGCYAGTKPKQGTIMSYCHLTTFGTQLSLHARVSAYMETRLAARTCVLAPGTMTVGAGPDTTICLGASIVLSGSVAGGAAPYTYFWTPLIGIANPNVLNATVTPTKNIKYVLEVRDNAGRVNTDTIKVTVGPPVSVTVPATRTVCTGSAVSISATAAGGDGAYQYTWLYDGVTTRTTQPTLTFTPLFEDTLLVLCLVADGSGRCQAVDTTTLYVHRTPYAVITGPTIACRGEVILLNVSLTYGRPPFTTQWMVNGLPKLLNDDNVLLKIDSSISLNLIVTDANGCSDTADHAVTMNDYVASISPSVVQLPAIPPCADTASARVVLTNTGTLPLTITQVNALVLTSPLPRTIAPGAVDTFDVHLVGLPTGSFTDTLKFYESNCAREFSAVVKGQRNGVRVASKVPLVVGPFIACLDSNSVDYAFTISNEAAVAVTLNLPEGQIVVPARSDTVIRRTIRDVFADSLVQDTLTIAYNSGTCQGNLSVPLHFSSGQNTLAKPDSIVFGDVFNDVAIPVSKSFQLTSTTGTIPFVFVDSVEISAPFSTSLKKGQRLSNGVPFTSTVALTVSQAAALGVLRDTLRVTFVGCTDVYELPLSAQVLLTTVHAETVSGVISITYREGAVRIRSSDESEFNAEVIDLQGRTVLTVEGQGQSSIDTRMFANGLYAVRVRTREGLVSHVIVVTR